jgi:hypothetical protein
MLDVYQLGEKMTSVKVPLPRSSVINNPSNIEIIIPIKRNIFVLLFLTAWLGGWGFGEISAIKELLSATSLSGKDLFLVFWLCGWTIGGGFAIFVWLWQISGRERLIISPMSLKWSREIFQFGWPKEYEGAHVKNLRLRTGGSGIFGFSYGAEFWGLGGGPIAFDYGSKTVNVGSGLHEPEAKSLIQQIGNRFPQFVETSNAPLHPDKMQVPRR